MQLMLRLHKKNCKIILIEEHLKYQHHHLLKFINMNILQVKKCYLLKQVKKNKKTKFIYLKDLPKKPKIIDHQEKKTNRCYYE